MSKKIVFLLGSANLSGGTYVILQHASYLKKLGFEVTIALVYMTLQELALLKKSDKAWHPALHELDFIHIDEAIQFQYDVAIYTWWATLFSFEKIRATSSVYFVQSIESRFYPEKETFMRDLVERTYQLGMPVITEAVWIQRYLQTNYASHCELARNGILKSLYTAEGVSVAKRTPDQLRILVEGPIDAIYKNVTKTIALCKQADVGEVWLLTSSPLASYPGVEKVFSQVPITAVPAIYRSCDVLVKLSYVEGMFGPPLEMFHCGGTAIVYDVTGHDEYIEHGVNALVAKSGDEQSVINYLTQLHENRSLLKTLTEGAIKTAEQWVDWEQSSQDFTDRLETLTSNTAPRQHELLTQNINKHLREYLDVVIVNHDKREQFRHAALPLYESGAYAIMVPVSAGETEISILFGKEYESFYIQKVEVSGIDDALPDGAINMTVEQLIQQPDQSFHCQSEQSKLVMRMNLQDKNQKADAMFRARVEFKPVALRSRIPSAQKTEVL